jgi:hypothetical protein
LIDADGVDTPIMAEIAIGEPPRAIGGAAGSSPTASADGTRAAAAVDVVRVRALPGAPAELADLRVGHMEASAEVPSGGIDCAELRQPVVTPAPETKVLSATSEPLARTGAATAATVVAGALLAAAAGGGIALSRRLR